MGQPRLRFGRPSEGLTVIARLSDSQRGETSMSAQSRTVDRGGGPQAIAPIRTDLGAAVVTRGSAEVPFHGCGKHVRVVAKDGQSRRGWERPPSHRALVSERHRTDLSVANGPIPHTLMDPRPS